jgi:hypothetical protein
LLNRDALVRERLLYGCHFSKSSDRSGSSTASRLLDFDAEQLTIREALPQVFDEAFTTIANRRIIRR